MKEKYSRKVLIRRQTLKLGLVAGGSTMLPTPLISLLAVVMAAGSLGYSANADAKKGSDDDTETVVPEQIFILSDGVTETLVEPEHHEEANYGAFEGGPTGTLEDTRANLVIPEDVQRGGGGGFNIPTGAPPSPLLFNGVLVEPFTQKMLRFEEFGTKPLPDEGTYTPGGSLPYPEDYQSGPDSFALDAFLNQDIYPYPRKDANVTDTNPWWTDIQGYLGYDLSHPPAEGRPPGVYWSHQRYDEFYPQNYLQTAQAGARRNEGLRNDKQLHNYAVGEFGPGGSITTPWACLVSTVRQSVYRSDFTRACQFKSKIRYGPGMAPFHPNC